MQGGDACRCCGSLRHPHLAAIRSADPSHLHHQLICTQSQALPKHILGEIQRLRRDSHCQAKSVGNSKSRLRFHVEMLLPGGRHSTRRGAGTSQRNMVAGMARHVDRAAVDNVPSLHCLADTGHSLNLSAVVNLNQLCCHLRGGESGSTDHANRLSHMYSCPLGEYGVFRPSSAMQGVVTPNCLHRVSGHEPHHTTDSQSGGGMHGGDGPYLPCQHQVPYAGPLGQGLVSGERSFAGGLSRSVYLGHRLADRGGARVHLVVLDPGGRRPHVLLRSGELVAGDAAGTQLLNHGSNPCLVQKRISQSFPVVGITNDEGWIIYRGRFHHGLRLQNSTGRFQAVQG
mmetsp:Transcript_3331/g.6916  ORF Transcript_3331/g.6916 Transcript_3331/m.6916 type:complete len:342 (+) Transcript_3331:1684-2709(+)